MKLIIIRHADPDYENNTLTKTGFIEAEVLGEYLKDYTFDKIYTSPYPRSTYTAQAICNYHKDKELIVMPWLHEFDYKVDIPNGQLNHISWDIYPDYYTNLNDFYNNDKYLDLPFFKKADIKDKYNFVTNSLDELLKENGYQRINKMYKVNKANEKTIILVCHFGLMTLIMSHLMNIPYSLLANTFICPPTGITTFITEERKEGQAIFRCNGFGDISHLKEKKMTPSVHGRFCEIYNSNQRH